MGSKMSVDTGEMVRFLDYFTQMPTRTRDMMLLMLSDDPLRVLEAQEFPAGRMYTLVEPLWQSYQILKKRSPNMAGRFFKAFKLVKQLAVTGSPAQEEYRHIIRDRRSSRSRSGARLSRISQGHMA